MRAYQTFRLQIKFRHSAITPWQSDTIFGGFCWAYAYLRGEAALETMLADYAQGNPSVVFSAGFPGDLLPKPLFGLAPAPDPVREKRTMLNSFKEEKKIKKITYLSIEEFQQFQSGQTGKIAPKENPLVVGEAFHNQIDRNSGTTAETGALFSQSEWFSNCHFSVYLKIREGFEEETRSTFEALGQIGLGKKRSLGRGGFDIMDFDLCHDFDSIHDPNAFVCLSNFVPAKDDPTEGYYNTMVKYGKTEFGPTGNPFKKPLIMLTPGAVFKLNGELKPFYGRMIQGLTNDNRVYHYGMAFAIPAKLNLSMEKEDHNA